MTAGGFGQVLPSSGSVLRAVQKSTSFLSNNMYVVYTVLLFPCRPAADPLDIYIQQSLPPAFARPQSK